VIPPQPWCPPRLDPGTEAGIQAAPSVIIPPTAGLDARVNPRIKSGGVHDGSIAPVFGHLLSEDLLAREAKISLANWKISLAKCFRFACPRLNHWKHSCFQCREILDLAVSNVIKALRPNFVSPLPRRRFLVVGPEVGQGFFFTEHFSLPWIQLFGKQISDHVTEWLKHLLSRRAKTTSRAASAAARHALSGLDPGTEQAFEDPLYGAQDSRSSPLDQLFVTI
jgi:hypothetical protein